MIQKGGYIVKTVKKIQQIKPAQNKKLRVAAYARVSHAELLQSLSNQVSYYSELIQNHSEWEYKGVYVDSAITGRNIKQRKEYQRLIQDCKEGKIDVILTKSISRFGRNTIDLLKTIRELRRLNVSVRFEKENIDTMTTDGELLLTLLVSIAEEESKAIGQNIKWRVKEKFQQGLPHSPQDMYGYRWQEDAYVIELHEASIIQQIYEWYLNGHSPTQIAKILNEKREKTRKGNAFTRSVIHNILSQDTYTGRLILQKTYRVAHKGRSVMNQGEHTKYIVEQAHEPIISKEQFEEVQQVKATRSNHYQKGAKHGEKDCHHRSS